MGAGFIFSVKLSIIHFFKKCACFILFLLKILFLMLFDQMNNCQFLKEDSAAWDVIETCGRA